MDVLSVEYKEINIPHSTLAVLLKAAMLCVADTFRSGNGSKHEPDCSGITEVVAGGEGVVDCNVVIGLGRSKWW